MANGAPAQATASEDSAFDRPVSADPGQQAREAQVDAQIATDRAAGVPSVAAQDLPRADRGKELSPKEMRDMLVDRQKAREEMKGKFDVIPDDFVGPRMPNQVTQAEYDKVCNQVSDIRRGKADLQFGFENDKSLPEDKRKEYQDAALNDVTKMMQTPEGRKVVGQLADNENGKVTKVNLARAMRGTGPEAECANDMDPRGKPDPTNAQTVGVDARGNPVADLSQPRDTRINYVPGGEVPVPSGKAGSGERTPASSDRVLFHELDHALRMTQGAHFTGPLASGPKVDVGGHPDPCQTTVTKDPATGEVVRVQARASKLQTDEAVATQSENRYGNQRDLLGDKNHVRPAYLAGDEWKGVERVK